jgi:hypothetical protein
MTKIPIDLRLLIRPVSSHRFEDVVERLTKVSIPRFFSVLAPGGSVWQSEVLLEVVCTSGVRNAQVVRMSRASDSRTYSLPPEKLEFTPEEVPTLGNVEVAEDPTLQTRTPF